MPRLSTLSSLNMQNIKETLQDRVFFPVVFRINRATNNANFPNTVTPSASGIPTPISNYLTFSWFPRTRLGLMAIELSREPDNNPSNSTLFQVQVSTLSTLFTPASTNSDLTKGQLQGAVLYNFTYASNTGLTIALSPVIDFFKIYPWTFYLEKGSPLYIHVGVNTGASPIFTLGIILHCLVTQQKT